MSNRLTKLGSILLVLTLMTMSFVGGTLAKYTTSSDATATARVAKFGVDITINGETFATAYDADDNATAFAQTVMSSNTDNVIAPGTSGNFCSTTLTGTPEVAVMVTYTSDFKLEGAWEDADGNYYCPLIITVNDEDLNGMDYASITEFQNAVNTAVSDLSKEYAANTNLNDTTVTVPAISWEWPFEVNDTNNVKDTFLGDAAVNGDITVSIGLNVEVTQID